MPLIIAVDGPAGAGKGTLSKRLASHYNLGLLETGLLYRYVAVKAIECKVDLEDELQLVKIAQNITLSNFDEKKLRTPEASQVSSKISVFPLVRQALLNYQKEFANNPGKVFQGSILDGRDIGTKICPDATAKFFLTANIEIRAQRRLKELQSQENTGIYSDVLKEMNERDARDRQRTQAPLTVACDACVIDTTDLSPEDVFNEAIRFIEMRRSI